LPSDDEWTALENAVGGRDVAKKLKSKSGWNSNGNGTDEFGFSALRAATASQMAVSSLPATTATDGVPLSTIATVLGAGACTTTTAMWAGATATSYSCSQFVASRTSTKPFCQNPDTPDEKDLPDCVA